MSKHMMRLTIPRSWPLPKKTHHWATKPLPGPHSVENSIPLVILLRDYLEYADTAREARMIIGAREILVDGKVCTEYKRGIGLMDIVSIPKTDEHFRLLPDRKGKLRLVRIDKSESEWKLARIAGKTTVKGGKTQLHFHDGRNIVLDANKYNTGDVLKIQVPQQRVLKEYKMKDGMMALVIGGSHTGEIGPIVSQEVTRSPKPNIVRFEEFSTIRDYVFVVGEKKPEIALPEVVIA